MSGLSASEENQEEKIDGEETPVDIFDLSDEDFRKLNLPDAPAEETPPVVEEAPTQEATPPVVEEPVDGTKEPEAKPTGEQNTETRKDDFNPSGSQQEAAAEPDYKAFYEQVMKQPIKANGKPLEIRDTAEAVRLMQMGANYNKKMQDLQPHRKVLTMLQNNGLLDEARISYLIDLDKKNPEAVKKLIKDAGIDPLDIDTSVEPSYQAGSHIVDDDEVNFRTTMEELRSTPTGIETIQIVSNNWDDASKEALYRQPAILTAIHEQRETGVFETISTEVERRKTLGLIGANTPFLEAYVQVGDELARANPQTQTTQNQGTTTTQETTATQSAQTDTQKQPEVVGTRVIAPKSQVANGDLVGAAAVTKSSNSKAQIPVNFLAMSDEEFMASRKSRS